MASKDVKKNESWYLSDTLSAVIGQSYNNFSPIQMAKYISILANGGNYISPTLIKSIVKSDGEQISKEEIKQYTNSKLGITENDNKDINIKKQTLDAIYEGMRSVTGDAGGTAYNIFKNFEIEVAGKTGSAEAGSKTNAWFVGFAPYDKPEIAVVVIVENGGHGNYTAEVVLKIMQEYFKINDEKITENMKQDSMGITIN